MTAEEYFLSKFGNKITATESWVIVFAEEYATQKTKDLKLKLWECEQHSTDQYVELNTLLRDYNSLKSLHNEILKAFDSDNLLMVKKLILRQGI